MGASVRFRTAPGVRLRVATRGPRTSVGPRITRVDPDGGPSEVCGGERPFSTWSRLSGGGHAPPAARAASRKTQEWGSVRAYLDDLLSAHTHPVGRATAPVMPPPDPVSRRAVRRNLRQEAVVGLSWWELGARVTTRAEADTRLDDEVARRRAVAAGDAASAQAQADAWWTRLLANDPGVVVSHLDRALADHAMPATVTAVEGDHAHLVIPVSTAEKLIGPREPTPTGDGERSLARITKPRRHELFEAAVTSAMLAVAAEAFAVAPGIMNLHLAVVAPGHLGGPAVLMLAELSRDAVLPEGADRPVDGNLVAAAEAGRVSLVRDKGSRVGALRPLDDDVPGVRGLLDVLDAE